MTDPSDQSSRTILVGLIRLRDHCTFNWRRLEGEMRTVEILPHHCEACLREARRRGFKLVQADGTPLA